jgi:hypothetical protein
MAKRGAVPPTRSLDRGATLHAAGIERYAYPVRRFRKPSLLGIGEGSTGRGGTPAAVGGVSATDSGR